MPGSRLFGFALGCAACFFGTVELAGGDSGVKPALATAREEPGTPPAELYWRPVDRSNAFELWRSKIALLPGRPEAPVVIGGSSVRAQAEGALLVRQANGSFAPLLPFPHRTERSFVLDFDQRGELWLAPFRPGEPETYGGLRVLHRRGEDFSETTVRPGLWPQAIDVIGTSEGYIAGNHGRFLRLENGRWYPEQLEGPAERWQDHNFLALQLLPDGDGWAAGKPGLLARRRNGRFHPVPVPAELVDDELTDLAVDPSGRLFLTTYSGAIARFDGRNWDIARVAAVPLLGIDLIGDHDGFAVGAQGTLLRFDGRQWRKQAFPSSTYLFDVAMATPTRGYLAGRATVFEATTEAPLFVEAEASASLPMLGQRAVATAAADLDLDGDLDLLIGSSREAWLFENLAPGFAPGRLLPFAPPSRAAQLLALVVGEVDGNGRPDLLASYVPGSFSLLLQRDDFSFTESTAAAHLDGIDSGSEGGAEFVDLDLDGDLDLYLFRCLDARGSRFADLALANDGQGRFNRLPFDGGAQGVERTALWGDLDHDRRPDLVLPANGHWDSSLWLDPLRGRPGPAAGLAELPPGLYYQGHLADLDLDGHLDLLLFAEDGFWLPGLGDGRFASPRRPFAGPKPDSQQPARLSAVVDLDLDGRVEVLVTRHHDGRAVLRVEKRDQQGNYHDVATEWGLADLKGEAILPFDFDRDGDVDLLVADPDGLRLLINQLQERRKNPAYLALTLRGGPGNPNAIGAEVRVFAERDGHQPELLHFEVSALGDSLGGRRPAGFFLFPAPPSPARLEVTFPGGDRSTRTGRLEGRLEVEEKGSLGVFGARRPRGKLGRWPLLLALVLASLGGIYFWRRRQEQPALLDRAGHETIGPYQRLERIGGGGVGEVFRGRSQEGQQVALKILHPHLADDRETRLRFVREAELLMGLAAPGLVRGLDRGEHAGRPYLVTELLEGATLRQWLDRHGGQGPAALPIFGAVVEILSGLHDLQLVHRDLKSDNVFVLDAPAETAGAARLKLLDLGLVRGGLLATLTGEDAAVGTLAYMAPEQLRGERVGQAADLWALGLLLAELFQGQRPTLSAAGELGGFLTAPGQPPSEKRLRELFPEAWLPLLGGLLAARPEQRFADLAAVRAELALLLAREKG